MISKEKRAQYLVRGVPPEVDERLRQRARQAGKSLNAVIVETLQQAAISSQPKKYRDLSDIAGGEPHDPAWEKEMQDMRQIDWEEWK